MRTFIQRLDDYIEFAQARKCFSDVHFYKELKTYIQDLEKESETLSKWIEPLIRSKP